MSGARPPIRITALACAAALLAAGPSAASAIGPAAGPPATIRLARGWQFQLETAKRAGATPPRAAAGKWRTVSVPGVFDPHPRTAQFAGTSGWYRLQFRTPPTPRGYAWALRFDEARRVAQVWLNGRFVGAHNDPYTAFQLNLPALRAGAGNALLVHVTNRKGPALREGWWNWGGLIRAVTLVPRGPVTLSSLGLLPQLSCPAADRCAGRLLVRGMLTNRTAAPIAPRVTVRLTSPGGGAARTATVTLARLRPGQSAPVRGTLELAGRLQAWSPDHPLLYHARVQTLDGTRLVQRNEVAVGLRRVDVRGGLLYLNGRAVQLRGASIEEDVPGRGPALTPNDAKRIVGELQALHANVTRAQYPLNEALLEQFDRAGILVWSQAPIYHRDEQLRTAAQRGAALATLRGTLLQTRNHPSVLTESVANELSPEPDAVPGTRDYIRSAVQLVRQLAPSIPVSIDLLSYPGYPVQRSYAAFDLLGINNYFGWYTGRRGHSTASIDDLDPYLREAHTRYPRQALVMSEFGAEANVNGPATVKQTYAFQSHYVAQTLGIVDALPFMSGAIYWTLREFAVKPRWDGGAHRHDIPRTAIHHKGLISYSGRPKPAFYVAARLFSHTPLYRVPTGSPKPGGPPGGWLPHVSDSVWLLALLGVVALGGALIARPRRRQRRDLAARDSSP